MRSPAVLFAAVTFFAAPAAAQPAPDTRDHLEPDPSIIGGGFIFPQEEMKLRELLGELYVSDVALRMIVRPSFDPEFGVGLRKIGFGNNISYQIVGLALERQVDSSLPVTTDRDGNLLAPPFPDTPKTIRCEFPIDGALGNRIVDVWHKMLLRTRYPDTDEIIMGTDGIRYNFSMSAGIGISGNIWFPSGETMPGKLVALGLTMRDVCEKNPDAKVADIRTITAELERRLK